jgi:hypothetical protein
MAVKTDYDQDSVDCCLSHLIQLFTILGEFREHIAIVGGWVPYFLCNNPNEKHTGSVDIDLVLEFDAITDDTYDRILAVLSRHGFVQGKQPFIYAKEAVTDFGVPFEVEVDLLAGEYGGTSEVHRHQRVQDVRARKVRGADLVFRQAVLKTVRGRLPDGALNEVIIKVAGVVPFLVMKGMTIWTRKSQKDAYDICYAVSNYPSGLDSLVKDFEPYKRHGLVTEGLGKIRSKFLSPEHIGPAWVADFMEVEDPDEIARVRRDAYEKVSRLLDQLEIGQYEGQ